MPFNINRNIRAKMNVGAIINTATIRGEEFMVLREAYGVVFIEED